MTRGASEEDDVKTSENTDQIDAAIAEFQGALMPVGKNKEVKVDGDKARWSAGYATFAAMLAAVRPLLAKHGIALYQGGRCTGQAWTVVTRVSCGGQWVEVEYPVKTSRDGAQGFGGGVSFAKRWGLRDVLGIEVPDDAEEGQGYRDAQRDAKPPRRAAAPAGIATALSALRTVPFHDLDAFAAQVERARGAYPTGNEAAAVEKDVSGWIVAALGNAKTADEFTDLRTMVTKVKPRGLDVRNALGDAERRLVGGAS
jgi:hypothetical protein